MGPTPASAEPGSAVAGDPAETVSSIGTRVRGIHSPAGPCFPKRMIGPCLKELKTAGAENTAAGLHAIVGHERPSLPLGTPLAPVALR